MGSEAEVYAKRASEYEALVSHEDYHGNILRAIREITRLHGLDVLDLGAGTGRLACLLAPYARSVVALDLSRHMLGVARGKLQETSARSQPPVRWLAAASDHRFLPLPAHSSDLIVSGWSVSYLAVWFPGEWRAQTEAWLTEVRRVLRAGGQVILLESLGTGNKLPERLPHLENFYGWLDEQRFQFDWIRTDYQFESPEAASRAAGFFFGAELEVRILQERLTVLPECTGVWWLNP